jgi:hypothetical protein
MTLQFHKIVNDDRYHFIHDNLRQVFRKAIEKAGRKNIVFVEGYDDKVIYGILYEEYLKAKLCFIDISFEAEKVVDSEFKSTGGCEKVKQHLRDFVQYLPTEKRFYGVIDRDLKTDEIVKAERKKPDYDGRLFIFFERYTLENYFVEPDILFKFLEGQSIKHKKLIALLEKGTENLEKEVINPILTCLASIAAANLTIRNFKPSEEFLRNTTPCKEEVILKAIEQKLKRPQTQQKALSLKFLAFKKDIIEKKETQKFASAKQYLSTQLNMKLRETFEIPASIELNNYKSELARILKEKGLPKDFQDLLSLINPQ